MVKKIIVPRETTESIATLVYPSGFSVSLPDECPSNQYLNENKYLYKNVLVWGEKDDLEDKTRVNCEL